MRAQEPREARGPTDHKREHSAGAGIEGPRMADAGLVQQMPHARHDVVGRGARWFVENEEAVHEKGAWEKE